MRSCVAAFIVLTIAVPVDAAVIVVANYTPGEVTFTLAEPDVKPRKHTLPAHHVLPCTVHGPADMLAPANAKVPVRVEPYNAYVLIPDRETGVRVELLELPGQPPDRDSQPERNPPPRDPVKIPVTLLVDDADPRADAVWHDETRRRFEKAATVLEAQTGFRFEVAGFETWKSDPKGKQVESQLGPFEASAKVKPGAMAVGFTSRKLDDGKNAAFGACAGRGAAHVLVRELRPPSEAEKVEVLVRYLAVSLGATTSPDPGCALRPKLGDGAALAPGFVTRLDPLNTLALNLWADQRRAGVTDVNALGDVARARFLRVYKALLLAAPGDPLATETIRDLEKDQGKAPEPGGAKTPAIPADRAKRLEAIRAVVRAVADRAKANTGAEQLRGDDLAAELMRVAAEAANRADEPDRAPAFSIGIGIALDDGAALRDNPLTTAAVKDVEADAARKARVAALGNPTLGGRRDLCKRFAIGCATGELLTPTAAENTAVSDALFALHKANGFSFPALAAEVTGISFARSVNREPKLLARYTEKFTATELLPNTTGLRDGLGADKFEDDFGSASDPRFTAVLTDIRTRVKALTVNRGHE